MESKYDVIKEIHRKAHGSGKAEVLRSIPGLLESWGIMLRKDDGELYQVNITNPEQTNN